MTISTTTTRNDYVGNGSTTVFQYSFRILNATDLAVYSTSTAGVRTTLAYPTDYTVSGVGNASGGAVTLSVAPASSALLAIVRATPRTQPTSFCTLGTFMPEQHEEAFDRGTMIAQDLAGALVGVPMIDPSINPASISSALVPSTGKVLGWLSATSLGNITLDSGAIGIPGGNRTVSSTTTYLLNNAQINVKDYGAVGNGTTDDTSAIQAALNDVPASGAVVYFPPTPSSFYRITAALTVKSSTVISAYGAILKNTGTGHFSIFAAVGSTGTHKKNIAILGASMDANGTVLDINSSAISASYIENLYVRDCTVLNSWSQGIGVGASALNVWLLNNTVTGAWGDGIHIGDQFSGETIANIWIRDNVVSNSWDDGIAVTAAAHHVWIESNKVDGVTQAAGIDISGGHDIFVRANYVRNYGQIGIRMQAFGGDAYAVLVEGNTVEPSNASNQYCINAFSPNYTTPTKPVVIRGNRCDNGANSSAGCIFVAGAPGAIIEDNVLIGSAGSGVTLGGGSGSENTNVVVRRNSFNGFPTAIATGDVSTNDYSTFNNTFLNCTNKITPSGLSFPKLWETDKARNYPFFTGASYVTSSVTSATEIDASCRIKKVTAGQRVRFDVYAGDQTGIGHVQLYDVTASAALATIDINSAGPQWWSATQLILATDAELAVRWYRNSSGANLTVKSALLTVF